MTLVCRHGHRFEIARAGYVNLLPGTRLRRGDTEEMVRARERFLATGAYRALDSAIAALVRPRGLVVEVGAGTGEHLARLLEASDGATGLAMDLARPAAIWAARRHPRVASVIVDVEKTLPLKTGIVAAFLSVFAPRNILELWRGLDTEGALIIARAGSRHLEGSSRAIGVDPLKEERLSTRLRGYFEEADRREVMTALELSDSATSDLIRMGPNAFHLPGGDRPHAPRVTAHFIVSRYRRLGRPR